MYKIPIAGGEVWWITDGVLKEGPGFAVSWSQRFPVPYLIW